MKKIPHSKKLYLIKKSIRVLASFTMQNSRQQLSLRGNKKRRPKINSRRPKIGRYVTAPEIFLALHGEWRYRLFDFLKAVERELKAGEKVRLNFDDVKELHPCGTLVFISQLDRWLEQYPSKLSCDYPKDEVVEQLFQHVSILSRLGLPPRKKIDNDRVTFWHYHCGSKADPSGFKDLTLSVIDEIDHPERALFADCLNEAVCNTVGHAYKFFDQDVLPTSHRKWWIFSQYRDDRLFVVIYDAGEGIPKSLRRKPEWREYLKFRQYNDSRIIESAIISNRTSTKQPERGKGLPEMLEFSKLLRAGGLSIWSAKGGFEYDASAEKLRRHKFKKSLPGTLVQWAIPFRKEQQNAKNDNFHS